MIDDYDGKIVPHVSMNMTAKLENTVLALLVGLVIASYAFIIFVSISIQRKTAACAQGISSLSAKGIRKSVTRIMILHAVSIAVNLLITQIFICRRPFPGNADAHLCAALRQFDLCTRSSRRRTNCAMCLYDNLLVCREPIAYLENIALYFRLPISKTVLTILLVSNYRMAVFPCLKWNSARKLSNTASRTSNGRAQRLTCVNAAA